MKKTKYLLILLLGFFHFSASGQVFQKTTISAIQQMENNFGNAIADYDLDGDLDIFIVAYDGFERSKPSSWSRLLENRGSALFIDVTKDAKLDKQFSNNTDKDNKVGAAWGDYDNDGFPDLVMTHAGQIQLFHNQQDGTFDETSTAIPSTCDSCVNTSALWWDYNRDGWLDLYISDYVHANRLFSNNGDGTFADVSAITNLADAGSTWCSLAIDVDRDGWQDLYVINDYGFSRLYLSESGKTFREATREFGLINTGSAMGVTVGDYNGDGHFDIYVTNISEFQPNALFTGSASGVFTNDSESQMVGQAHWAWGTKFFDADHDGDEDLYAVNGFENFTYPNKFFRSNWAQGSPDFTDWSVQAQCDGDAHGMGLEVFDYDNDGDLDMLATNTNSHPYLYQNVGVKGNTNWVQIDLEGTVSNRNAFGAIVQVIGAGKSFHRYHHGAGIMSQCIAPVHIGMGSLDMIDTLMVTWPSTQIEYFYNIPTNQKIKIVENADFTTSSTTIDLPNAGLRLISVSPQPSQNDLTVQFHTSMTGQAIFELFDMNGRVVDQTSQQISTVGVHQISRSVNDAAQWVPGIYTFRLRIGHHIVAGKIIRS